MNFTFTSIYISSFVFLPLAFIYNSLYYACFVEETLSLASAVKAGADKVAGITRERYMDRLIWLRALSRFHIMEKQDDKQKISFIRISNVLENLRLDSSNGTIRKQPYCIILSGPPGCGKTGTAMKIAAHLIRAQYGKFYPTDIVTLNETDEFQSEYRTNHKVVIFDDMSAEVSGPQVVNPWRKVIDFVNNIRKTALNPNLELKGNVYIEPELVIITTNRNARTNFSIPMYMACPDAIIRRFSQVIILQPDFKNCEIVPVVRQGKNSDTRMHHSNLHLQSTDNNRTLLIEEFIEETKIDFLRHQQEQQKFVSQINSIYDYPNKTNNPIQAFISDVVKPYWFTKYKLSTCLERELTWYQRLGRLFCFEKDKPLFSVQSGMEDISTILDFQSKGKTGRDYYLQQNFNYSHFFMLEKELDTLFSYCPVPHGFLSENHIVILPNFCHLYTSAVLPATFYYTLDELKDEAERQLSLLKVIDLSTTDDLDRDSDSMSDITPIDNFSQQPSSPYRNPKLIDLKYDDVNLTFPMKGFVCKPSQDDQFMQEFLEVQPLSYKLILREWVSDLGVGDFVFYHKGKDEIPFFLVVEIKSHNIEVASAQARKYGNELLRQLNLIYAGQKKVMAVGIIPTAFEFHHIFGVDKPTRAIALKAFERWFINFTRRCGALRESSDSNEL